MIGEVLNFNLASRSLESGITTLIFEFDKPTGDFGAYKLYQMFPGEDPEEVKLRIDYAHYKENYDADYTYEEGGKVYFEYSLQPGPEDGREVHFRLRAVSISNELSSYTSIVSVQIAPTKPENLLVQYDGYQALLTWDELDTTDDKNSNFTNFVIRRKRIQEIATSNISYDSDTKKATYDGFEVGKAIWVIDTVRKSTWFSDVETEGEFTLSDSIKITTASDNASDYIPSIDNLRFLIENDTTTEYLNTSLINEYIDTSLTQEIYYIYTVTSEGGDNRESEETKFPIFTLEVTNAYPYLRSPNNSNNEILQQPYWKYLKEVLIDKNYYDKTKFAIPYFTHELYNLKGYLGISNCKLDVYINDIYNHTTSTGEYGEFNINYAFKKGETVLTFQARDKYNIKFSRKSGPYSIRTLNLYSWFAALGEEYKEVVDTIINIKQSFDIANVDYSVYQDMYAPFIEIYKYADEDQTEFITMADIVFKSFEYASFDKSLIDILDAFQEKVTEFDHYELYFNNNIFSTHSSGRTYTFESSALSNINYWYGVSACNTSTGAETDVIKLRVDRRWWDNDYLGINILFWDEVTDANLYKIYRGATENNLVYLSEISTNIYCDIGQAVPGSDTPRLYNYTSLNTPTNLQVNNDVYVTKLIERLKKPNSMTIILYGVNDSELPEFELDRIKILLQKIIPPEIQYTLRFARDSETEVIPIT